ncbi:MAG: hypothetical protein ACKVZH_25805, partial [Blastocatellia bacterium]
WQGPIPIWSFWVFITILLALSGWIFYISCKFQSPILFDSDTEKKRKTEVEKLVKLIEALDDNKTSLTKLTEVLERKAKEEDDEDDKDSSGGSKV